MHKGTPKIPRIPTRRKTRATERVPERAGQQKNGAGEENCGLARETEWCGDREEN